MKSVGSFEIAGQGPVAGSCENGNMCLGSIKKGGEGEFLCQVS